MESTDETVLSLYELYRDNQGSSNCPYDFNELETFLDKIWLKCDTNQKNIDALLEESKNLQETIVNRLNDIYERLGQLPDYNEILERILNKLDNLSSSDEDYDGNDLIFLEEIRKLLEENNKQNRIIIGKLDDVIDELQDIDKDINLQNKARQCANKAKEVFPTCIPWDLARLVNALSADPVTPVIEVPIQIASVGISETFVVDLHQFDDFAGKFRKVFVMLFGVGLMILT